MDNVIRLFGANTVPRSFSAKVRFKTRVKHGIINVPELGRQHCDMADMRRHSKLGSYANSTLFVAMLGRYVRDELGVGKIIDLNSELPPCVTWTGGDFMVTVTIDLGA